MGIGTVAKRIVKAPKTVTVGFWSGLSYPFKGMKFVYLSHPGLIRYWGVPILLTLVALVGVVWGAWDVHAAILDSLWATPTQDGWWGKVLSFLHSAVDVLVGVFLILVGAFAVVALTSVFAAPFNDLLSEEVERLVTGKSGPPFSVSQLIKGVMRTVAIELCKLFLYALIMLPLFLLSLLVPGVGQVIYTVFGFFFTSLYFAIDYIDWPASRRNKASSYRISVVRKNFMPMFGFGTGVWLFLLVPIVNLLFMPAAVAGGTLLFLHIEGEEEEKNASSTNSVPQ